MKCSSCSIEKESLAFRKHVDGYFYSKCIECLNAQRRASYIKTKSNKNKNRRNRYKNDSIFRNNCKKESIKYYINNKTKCLSRISKYSKENRGKVRAREVIKELRKKQATPLWLTDKQKNDIKFIYELSAFIRKITGVQYHVDHIFPIKGKQSCGLHVPWNLRIIPAIENIKKSNRVIKERF